MADKEKYMIKIEGKPIEVTQDVYYAYFRMERQERGQEEKKQRNSVMSYDALDTEESSGVEAMPDIITPSLEQQIIYQEMRESLHMAVNTLTRAERELIKAIYFEDLSERDFAKRKGLSQRGVNRQRRKILSKLKMFLKFMGSF